MSSGMRSGAGDVALSIGLEVESVGAMDSDLSIFSGIMNLTALPDGALSSEIAQNLTGLASSSFMPLEISDHLSVGNMNPLSTPVNVLQTEQKDLLGH